MDSKDKDLIKVLARIAKALELIAMVKNCDNCGRWEIGDYIEDDYSGYKCSHWIPEEENCDNCKFYEEDKNPCNECNEYDQWKRRLETGQYNRRGKNG